MRIELLDLVGRPGATRDVVRTVTREDLDVEAGSWGPLDDVLDSPFELDLVLEMLVDGLLVRGSIAFETTVPCARCLTDLHRAHTQAVSEMYLDPGRADQDEEVELGYELDTVEQAIDLEAMLRDSVSAVLDVRALCAEDCAGLCATCGADLNVESCGHGPSEPRDPRWAALESLDVPPG